MARSGGGSSYRARKTLPPIERYNRLSSTDQLICYYYWLYLISEGIEGWDTKKAGWKQHWTHHKIIKEKFTSNAFYNLGKSMAELAKSLSEKGIHLEKPNIFGKVAEEEIEEGSDIEEEEEPEELDNNKDKEVLEEETMPSKKTPTKKKATSSQMKIQQVPEKVSHEEEAPTLPYPMVWGSFKTFNYTLRKRYTSIVFRVLVHSFMSTNDIAFEWVNPRKLKIEVAWPEWWVNPEQQAEFDVDEVTGRPSYGIDHQLIGEIMENNEAKKGEDGRVVDVGFFTFDQDMSTNPEDTLVCLKSLDVKSTDQSGQFIFG